MWAAALYNVTVDEDEPDTCREIASEIAAIAHRQPQPDPDIDRAWAGALHNAGMKGSSRDWRRDCADAVEEIARRHEEPTPEIDEARARFWLCVLLTIEGDNERDQLMEERIRPILERLEPHPRLAAQLARWWESVTSESE